MMDTVLNLGLNDETVQGLAKASGDRRFAYDSYRRFIQMYGDVVLGVDHYLFEEKLEDQKRAERRQDRHGPRRQGARDAWSAPTRRSSATRPARTFPRIPGTSSGAPSAPSSAPGTCRAPSPTGACNDISGEHGHGGQRPGHGVRQHGRRLRHGRRLHPQPVDRREGLLRRVSGERPGRGRGRRHPHAAVAEPGHGRGGRRSRRAPRWRSGCRRAIASWRRCSSASSSTTATCRTSSSRCSEGKLWVLQTRTGKRTAAAALKIAVDMANEGLIERNEAIARVEPCDAGPAAAPDPRSVGRARDSRQGAAGLAGRRVRHGGVHGRGGRKARGRRRGGDPRADRDLAGGHPRHARRQGHRHRARRHDEPCRGRRARHGQALRLRCQPTS